MALRAEIKKKARNICIYQNKAVSLHRKSIYMFNFYFKTMAELPQKLSYVPKNHTPFLVTYERWNPFFNEELVIYSKAKGATYRFVSLGPDYSDVSGFIDSLNAQLQLDF